MLRDRGLVSILSGSFNKLPSPININYWWNFGSLVGFFLVVQILTRFFLSIHYSGNVLYSFDSVVHLTRDVNFGWVIRYCHMNRASFFLGLIYLHTLRGILYKRYRNENAWNAGVTILILSILTAFLGYVLPWGQMSFWGATVITNLVTALPVVGTPIVQWIWGGFSVRGATLSRFYSIHFLVPFLIAALSCVHLFFIHEKRSGNPLGEFSDSMKVYFWPFYGVKDLLGLGSVFFFFMVVVFFLPDAFSDPDNFSPANSMVTPVHIKPEWYFLFAYAILRCIPNKLLGVVILVLSLLVLYVLPFTKKIYVSKLGFLFLFWLWIFNFVILTWLGGSPVESTYIFLSQVCGFLYFFIFFMLSVF